MPRVRATYIVEAAPALQSKQLLSKKRADNNLATRQTAPHDDARSADNGHDLLVNPRGLATLANPVNRAISIKELHLGLAKKNNRKGQRRTGGLGRGVIADLWSN